MAVSVANRLILLALAALLLFGQVARGDEWRFKGVDRVVAISDIHGAYGAMVKTLQSAAVIDEQLTWCGGSTHLVVVGDILDRGPDSRQAMDLLMRIEREAAQAGGRVHVLIGNHEAMNLIGDLRYVAKEEYAAFAAEEDAADRGHWFQLYQQKRVNGDQSPEQSRVAFDEQFPPGFFAHRKAFGSAGEYGAWLLAKPVMIVINDTAYVHGGVSPMIAKIGLQGVNGKLQGEMAEYVRQLEKLADAAVLLPTDSFYDHADLLQMPGVMLTTDPEIATAVKAVVELNDSDLHAPDGPLWYRGNVACSSVIEIDRLEDSLNAIGANRVVIGHTPTRGRRILERLDGRVLEVDTGMLNSYYEGHGNALVLAGDAVSVVNESGTQGLLPAPHPRYVGQRSGPDFSAATIEKLLATGDVLATQEDPAGRKIVSISDGARRVDAVFARRAGRGFYPEVAAYRLDRLLELDMVPVTVTREIDGKDGSLQFMPAATIDETRRRESGRGGGAMCPLDQQWNAMMVFDSLIFNEARGAAAIHYDTSTWQLILDSHSRSFTTGKNRPKHLQAVDFSVGPTWKETLSSLTEDVLKESLGDVLDTRRLRALGARRDMLLQ